MKKIKLITSLSTLGLIATATPIITTSCSSNSDSLQIEVASRSITIDSTQEMNTVNITSAKYQGKDQTIGSGSSFTYTDKAEKTNQYIVASFDVNTQSILIKRTDNKVTKEQTIVVNFNAVDGSGHKGTVTFNVTVKVPVEQTLTDVKYLGDDVATNLNIVSTDPIDPIRLTDFTAKYNGSYVTLETLTITSSAPTVVQADKVEGKEEYNFTVKGTGSTIITLVITDTNSHQCYKNIVVNVAKPTIDDQVAYIKIDDASSVEVPIWYNEDGTNVLGNLIGHAYNKEGQLLSNKTLIYEVEQKDRPLWLGNIDAFDGTIKAKAYQDKGGGSLHSWSTSFKVTCDGVTSASYPLTFYYVPAINQDGVIYEDESGEYQVLNYAADMTATDLSDLANESSDTITINGTTINKTQVLTVGIYSLASGVNTIPANFCSGFSNLLIADFGETAAAQITSIGQYFMHYCYALTSFDMTYFTGLTTNDCIGGGIFNCCDNLIEVNLGDIPDTAFTADDEDEEIYSFATTNSNAACYNPGITLSGQYASDVGIKFANTSSWWYMVYRRLIVA